MKKVFGIQAEVNITADDDVVRGLGKGFQNGSVVIGDIIKDLKPFLIENLKTHIAKQMKKQEENVN